MKLLITLSPDQVAQIVRAHSIRPDAVLKIEGDIRMDARPRTILLKSSEGPEFKVCKGGNSLLVKDDSLFQLAIQRAWMTGDPIKNQLQTFWQDDQMVPLADGESYAIVRLVYGTHTIRMNFAEFSKKVSAMDGFVRVCNFAELMLACGKFLFANRCGIYAVSDSGAIIYGGNRNGAYIRVEDDHENLISTCINSQTAWLMVVLKEMP